MPSGAEPVVLPGVAMVGLVRAVAALDAADLGSYVIVGGLAVSARLNRAHRATADVDTVVDESIPPDAITALLALEDTRRDADVSHRVYVAGTKVEILGVGQLGDDEDLSWATGDDALFVVAHRWALDTAQPLRIIAGDDPDVEATAPFATPAALIAMKLHAIETRSAGSLDKRAGDAWDLYRILADLDHHGAVRAAMLTAPPALRTMVADAVERVLVTGAVRTRGWMRAGDDVIASVAADELRLVAQPLLDTLRERHIRSVEPTIEY